MEILPAPEPAGLPEPPRPAPDPAAVRPLRRRGRTALIIAVAAVFGIVGGTVTGYTVQADRPPTPLAALSQPDLAYPAKPLPPGKAVDALSADGTGFVKTDGDLRKLLLSKPPGAHDNKKPWIEDGWSPLWLYSAGADHPDMMFEFLAGNDVRRIASRSWRSDGVRESNIDLLQFRAGQSNGGAVFIKDQSGYMTEPAADGGAGGEGEPLGDSDTDAYWVYPPLNVPGHLSFYQARALAQRGDVAVDINVYDSKPISAKYIRTLAERQLERL